MCRRVGPVRPHLSPVSVRPCRPRGAGATSRYGASVSRGRIAMRRYHFSLIPDPYAWARSMARSRALGKRVSKSRMPTHSGVTTTRAICGAIGRT